MTYVYERPANDWVCPTCGEGPDRCQMVSEGEMMYPPGFYIDPEITAVRTTERGSYFVPAPGVKWMREDDA